MKKVNLLEDSIGALAVRYMIPSVLGMLGLSMCIFFDTMFIGRGIGNLGLAALNVGVPMYSIFNSIGLIFGVGGATALSISIGKGRLNSANSIFTFSVISSFISGAILSVFGMVFLEQLSLFLGASQETLPLVKEYLSAILSFGIAFIVIQTLSVFVRNDNNPKLVMWAVICANLTNIILDYVLIFPLNKGMRGAALATSIAQLVGVSILLLHFIFKKNSIHLHISQYKKSLRYAKRVILNGIPSLVNEMSAGVVIFIFNIVLIKIGGVEAVSAYSIISNVALICTAIFNGISQGIQPIISMNYGAKKIDRVISAFKLARKISFVSGVIFFIIGVSNPEFIARIFSSNIEGILDITCSGIRIYFLSFIVMGVNIVSIGFMQSIERSKVSTIISLIRGFILISIVIVIMSYIMGLTGAWLTVPIVESITLIYTIIIIKGDKSIYLQK